MTEPDINEVYASIGEFCVEFEQISQAMEVCCFAVLSKHGLTDHSIQTVLLSGMTAEPLRALTQKLIAVDLKPDKKQEKILSACFKKVQDITSQRNDILHSKWMPVILNNGSERLPWVLGQKLHSNKSGPATKKFSYGTKEFKKATAECVECYSIFSLLTRCVLGFRKLEECFSLEGEKLKINKAALKPVRA